MNHDIIVFLGPSLSLPEAQSLLPATYLPPAKQGDILSVAVQYKPKIICLIDGIFSQTLSVWHKEILYAISQGTTVIGASSMGALRAAEMAACGMVGIGKIFELYHSGKVLHDDEVALIHGPQEEDYIPLSIPLINIRCSLQNHPDSEQILESLRKIDYPNRSFDTIQSVVSPDVFQFIQTYYIDQKKLDAIEALKRIPTLSKGTPQPFASTLLFDTLYHTDRQIDMHLPLRQIAHHAALHHPQFASLQFSALNQALASQHKVEVSAAEIEEEKNRFLQRHTIDNAQEWATRNHLTPEEFEEFFRKRAASRKLHRAHFSPWHHVQHFLDELKWNNQYEEWLEKAKSHAVLFQEASPNFNDEDHPDLLAPFLPDSGFENSYQMNLEFLKAKIVHDYLQNSLSTLFE